MKVNHVMNRQFGKIPLKYSIASIHCESTTHFVIETEFPALFWNPSAQHSSGRPIMASTAGNRNIDTRIHYIGQMKNGR